MTDQSDSSSNCLNCDASLDGPYCGQCGQPRSARMVPFKTWLGEFFGTFLKLDSKLLRTVRQILFQPGLATVNFGKGHRVPYASPAKVYIIVSAISIAAMSFVNTPVENVAVPGMEFDEDFHRTFQFLFPFVNLLSPFLTAGILVLLQRKFFFQLHLAFSLHIWAFYIAVATPLVFIPATSVWAAIAFLILSVAGAIYIFLAHRRVYNIPWIERIVCAGAVVFSIPLASVVFVALLVGLSSILS